MLIKICGIKTPEMAIDAVTAGATHIGIMQYSDSKRYVNVGTTKAIAAVVKAQGAIPVAVFVAANAQQMASVCQQTDISTVQLHGHVARQQHVHLPADFQRIYAVPVDAAGQLVADELMGMDDLNSKRDLLLFDSQVGGSGESFSWSTFNNPFSFEFFLAGGLDANNVVTAIDTCHPNGVDVSSGVEDSAGAKQLSLIQRFIDSVNSRSTT